MINLKRPIAGLDIESTGLDITKDRIIHLAIIKLTPTSPSLPHKEEYKVWQFNPGFPIPAESTAIHGITDEMVKIYPVMTEAHAKDIADYIAGCDLCGYNLKNYDVPMLWESLARDGIELNLDGVHIVDVGNIFKVREARTLESAVRFYCNREHQTAHSALGDVAETFAVLEGQLERYKDLAPMSVEELAKHSSMDDRIDLAGVIVRNKEGVPVFNTKRNRGVKVCDDIGYAEWFLRSDFTYNTKSVIIKLLDEYDKSQELFR